MEKDVHSDEEIRQILSLKNVAVIGMSKNSEKAAHYVPKIFTMSEFRSSSILM